MRMASVKRLVGLIAVLLLLPGAARATGVSADFNRDGVPDHVSIGGRGRALFVFLASHTSPVRLNARATIYSVVITDVDHDGIPDLVANTAAGLRIWINDGHGRFSLRRVPRHAEMAVSLRSVGSLPTDGGNGEAPLPGALAVARDALSRDLKSSSLSVPLVSSFAPQVLTGANALRGPPAPHS
jgi:hypothetical protein